VKLCSMTIASYTTIAQVKRSVTFELNITDNTEMKLYTHKGYELIKDTDLNKLTNNGIVFAVFKSIVWY